MIIVNEVFNTDKSLEENPTFMDRLKRGDKNFNIFSGSRNYVVTRISDNKFKVLPGKGFDKGSDAYLKKISDDDHIVSRNALENFIRMINRKMGYRESIDV